MRGNFLRQVINKHPQMKNGNVATLSNGSKAVAVAGRPGVRLPTLPLFTPPRGGGMGGSARRLWHSQGKSFA